MRELPIKEASAQYGCSRTNFQKKIKKGQIRGRKLKNGRWMIDLDSADEYYGRAGGTDKRRTGESVVDGEIKTNGKTPAKLSNLGKVEIALKLEKIEDQRLKNEIRKKELINRSDIGESAFEFFRPIRDSLQGEPDRIAAKIRAADSDHEATLIMREANHKILESAIKNYDTSDDELKKNLTEVLLSMLPLH
jgi:hypothetical protein